MIIIHNHMIMTWNGARYFCLDKACWLWWV